MRLSFRERNPLVIGIIGVITLILLMFLAFNLTIFSGGTTYKAAFTDASGLKPGEDVRIAGVKVGKVNSVGLESSHVKVSFNVNDNVHFGSMTRVQINISTILGAHYLNIQPQGPGRQPSHQEIPTSRTTAAYNVVPALEDVAGQAQQINVKELGTALNTLSATLSYSPDNVRRTLSGLQKISQAIASRDNELGTLLQHSKTLTATLANRSSDISAIASDGGALLQELNSRSAVIQSLLNGTVSLSQQITGTIQENKATLGPALTQLHRVVTILENNQGNLEKTLSVVGPFVSTAADATGNGRWFDGYLQNLIPLPASIAPPQPGTAKKAAPGSSNSTLPLFQ
jgi:phospholipid/cholesterol/gamma-HCH transport system substrate-binding protein